MGRSACLERTTFMIQGDLMTVGIREARAHFSECVRRVSQGEEVTITDRGRVGACLVPPNSMSNIDRGIAEGWITPPSRRETFSPIVGFAASSSVESILEEDRGG